MSHRRHRTTVVTFKEDLTKTTYSFNSKPNFIRIEKEAEADGVFAALVFPSNNKESVYFFRRDDNGRMFPQFFQRNGENDHAIPRHKTPMLMSVIHTVLGASHA